MENQTTQSIENKLSSIELSHFQSHKDTKLEFSPGINVIIGNSKDGKTAILRGVRQVKDNKPTGLGYNSYWNRDKKNKPIEDHLAKLDFSDVSISRVKAKGDRNEYVINEDVLEAVGKGAPPEEVTRALNLTDTNFQSQFSQPFLLSDSPAEIGRFFNRIVNLDLSDKILAEAEKDRRNTVSDITKIEKEIEEDKKELEGYDWINKAERIIKEYDECEENLRTKETELGILQTIYGSLIEQKEQLKEINKIPFQEIKDLLDEIEEAERYIKGLEAEGNEIYNLYEDLKSEKEELQKINKIPFNEIYTILEEIENIETNINLMKEEKTNIAILSDDLFGHRRRYGELRQEIRELERQMPSICPACSRPFEEK